MTEPSPRGGQAPTAGAAPTLQDVARLAGVSRATVSRVVNGGSLVSPETAETVNAAVRELGYQPNHAARMLVTRRSGVVAVLVPETDLRVFSDPYFAATYHGVISSFSGHEAQVVLAMSKPGEPAERLVEYLTSGRIDGAVVASHHGSDLPRALAGVSQPVVFIGDPGVPGLAYADLDNTRGAVLATQRLIQSGRRRLATVTGSLDMVAGQHRRAGFTRACAEAGITPVAIIPGSFTEASGREAARSVLSARHDIDGLFVASDLMAAGVMAELQHAGVRVPEDIAIVGFDDSEMARRVRPALTTVRGHAHEVAQEAGRMLRELLSGSTLPAPVILAPDLVLRDSA
ncbi:LacI family DNA-binding transcriptional regulator [Propioniciclava soli]|uniref:LacI family DNA-binding transcriptional regulator n=1 Tax=Propioniciclava soli TaxID=2775081 RepID=A0ABZ3CAG9_9ACTN|nr:LacI family DNA-binding transcriptional regulator [Propioniciclava soli]